MFIVFVQALTGTSVSGRKEGLTRRRRRRRFA